MEGARPTHNELGEEMNIDVMTIPVHPLAACWPMVSEEELAELANDIAENGLQQPVVVSEVDGQWVLIDGRNRLEACRLVHVAPAYTVFSGDVGQYILSCNQNRRHMTKGQRAMAVAMMFPDSEQGKKTTSLKINEVSGGYIRQARAVISSAPELVESVLNGARPLNDAYDEAKKRRDAGNSDIEKLAWLRSVSRELADKVVEGDLTLNGAIAEYKERENVRQMARMSLSKTLSETVRISQAISSEANIGAVCDLLLVHGETFKKAAMQDVDQFLKSLDELEKNIPTLKRKLRGN